MSLTPVSDALRADHRRIEVPLDALLIALVELGAERLPEVRRRFLEIRALIAPHFEKEETVLYPRLRPGLPELLARMDEQHGHAREVEHYLAELLGELADLPTARELAEVRRLGIELHDAIQHHIVEEEDDLLRIADAELSAEEQQGLFERMVSERGS
jgi:hemerythrin-like domain-containing protein